MLTVDKMKPGERGIIRGMNLSPKPLRRLGDMGVTVGAELAFIRSAPLGDPVIIYARGTLICLRKSDAKGIAIAEVTKIT